MTLFVVDIIPRKDCEEIIWQKIEAPNQEQLNIIEETQKVIFELIKEERQVKDKTFGIVNNASDLHQQI